MTEREKIYYDYGFLIGELDIKNQLIKHLNIELDKLRKENNELRYELDSIVTETLKRDLCND